MRKKPDTRTWTAREVAMQECALQARVSVAAKEMAQVKARHRAELAALRKFRRAKIAHADQIVN